MKNLRLVVLCSGTGSNLRAIVAAIEAQRCAAEVVAVGSDRIAIAALEFAAARGIATFSVLPKAYTDRDQWDLALAQAVAAYRPDVVVLAGFMRIVGRHMLAQFPHTIVNVHPALLPSFPGTHGAEQALAAGVHITGCTVHLVDAGVDTGPILAQCAVPIGPGDDATQLQARIQRAEHRLLPDVLNRIARGQIVLQSVPKFHEPSVALDATLQSPFRAELP